MRNIAVLITFMAMIFMVKVYRLYNDAVQIFILYALLISTTLLGALIECDTSGLVQIVKLGMYFSVLLVILCGVERNIETIELCMNIHLFIAVAISIQCLILFVVVWFDLMDYRTVYFEPYGLTEASYGILGYGNAINNFGKSSILRTSSFFKEPTKLGAFLLAPIFWNLTKYNKTKKKKYLFYETVMILNLLVTFSRAAWLAAVISILCWFVFRTSSDKKEYHVGNNKKAVGTLLTVGGLILVVLAGNILYRYSTTGYDNNRNKYEGDVLSGMAYRTSSVESSVNNAFIRDSSNFSVIVERVMARPIGYGLGWTKGNTVDFNNPTAFGYWVYSGGIPALFILIILYGMLFYRYFLPCMYSGDGKMKAIGMAFLGNTIQNMSYGTWSEPYYLMIVGLMIMIVGVKTKEISWSAKVHIVKNGRLKEGINNI
jgi:hypothetical protein